MTRLEQQIIKRLENAYKLSMQVQKKSLTLEKALSFVVPNDNAAKKMIKTRIDPEVKK